MALPLGRLWTTCGSGSRRFGAVEPSNPARLSEAPDASCIATPPSPTAGPAVLARHVSCSSRAAAVGWIRPRDAEADPGPSSGLEIVNCRGLTIVPGLVDAHCHLTSPGGANWLSHFQDPPRDDAADGRNATARWHAKQVRPGCAKSAAQQCRPRQRPQTRAGAGHSRPLGRACRQAAGALGRDVDSATQRDGPRASPSSCATPTRWSPRRCGSCSRAPTS